MNTTKSGLYFLLALLIGAGILSYFIFAPFISSLVLAVVFAVTLFPLYTWIAKRMGKWKGVAALLTVLIATVGIIAPLGLIGTQVVYEAADVYVSLVYGDGREQIEQAVTFVDEYIGKSLPAEWHVKDTLATNLSTYAEQGLQWILQHLGAAFSGVAGFILSLFLFLIALFYLLRDGGALRSFLIQLSPLPDSYDEVVLSRLQKAVNSVLRGSLTIALIQGVVSAVGFFIFGIPNPLLWGTVTAIAALVPGVGTALVLIPMVLFLFVTGNVGGAIGLLIWGAIAVGLVDNLLSPYLIGSGSQLHPLLVLIAVLGGLGLFGAVGIFLGPLILSLLMVLISIYSDITNSQVV